MFTRRTHVSIKQDERGQTMTEFALVLPLLCVLLFGVIQFGILYNNYVNLTDAVRAGARKAAVSRHTDLVAEGRGAVERAAVDLDKTKLEIFVSAPSVEHGKDVTVTAQYPYEIKLLDWAVFSGKLKSTTTERIE